VDFQFDSTTDGKPIKIVSVVDEHTRECLGGMVERRITGEHLITELDRLAARLEDAERELAQALAGLRAIAENEATTYELDGVRLSPSEVGAWLRERAATHGGIPDAVAEAPA